MRTSKFLRSVASVAAPSCFILISVLPTAVAAQTGQAGLYKQPYGKNPGDIDEAVSKVKSGSFNLVHLDVIEAAKATQAIPYLKEQFTVAKDVNTKDKIASALVRLGERQGIYWEFLSRLAEDALKRETPNYIGVDGSGKEFVPSPDFTLWAKVNHLSSEDAIEQVIYELPGRITYLAQAGDPDAIPILRQGLLSKNPFIQESASQGLAELQDAASIPLIIAACQRAPRQTARLLAQSLAFFNDSRAQQAVDAFVPADVARQLRTEKAQGKLPLER